MFRAWIFHVQLAVEQCASKWGEGVARACWLEGGEERREPLRQQTSWMRGVSRVGGAEGGGNFVPLWKHQSNKHTFELLCAGTGEKEGSFRNEITCWWWQERWGGWGGDSDEDVGDEDAQCWWGVWVGVTDWCSDAVAPASSIRPPPTTSSPHQHLPQCGSLALFLGLPNLLESSKREFH